MKTQIEPVFESEIRVVKNGEVIEIEKEGESDGEHNHNNQST